ncbi:hypothetical protein [Azospirillum sp. Marseille-Q6669]
MARPKAKSYRYQHSYKQRSYRKKVIESLKQNPVTSTLASRMERCATIENNRSSFQNVFRCGSMFCPDCRRHLIRSRIKKALETFKSYQHSEVFFVTLLFPTRHSLFLPIARMNTDADISNALTRRVSSLDAVAQTDIRRIKAQVGRLLDRAKLDRVDQIGWIEFATKMPEEMNERGRMFIDQSKARDWHGFSQDPTEVINGHAHFIFAATKDGRSLNGEEIGDLFRTKFDLPTQVMVKPLRRHQTLEQAVHRTVSYSMKTFVPEEPRRVQELALFFDATPQNLLRFDRRRRNKRNHRPIKVIKRDSRERIAHIRSALRARESVPGLIPWDF